MIDNLDKLTGLYTQKYFNLRLEEELARTRRYKRPLTLIFFEINYNYFMPEYNIRWAMVYTILKQFGALLLRQLRNVDIAGRYGGEMFSVLLPETPIEGGEIASERIRKKVEEHTFLGDNVVKEVRLAINGGMATSPIHGKSIKEMIASAHQALLIARNEGGNKVITCPNILYDDKGKSTIITPAGTSMEPKKPDITDVFREEKKEKAILEKVEKDEKGAAPRLKKKKKGRKVIDFKHPESETEAEAETEIGTEVEDFEKSEEIAIQIPRQEEETPEVVIAPKMKETVKTKKDSLSEADEKREALWKSLTEIRKIK